MIISLKTGIEKVCLAGLFGDLRGQLDQSVRDVGGGLFRGFHRSDGRGRVADLHLGHPRSVGRHVVSFRSGLIGVRHRGIR